MDRFNSIIAAIIMALCVSLRAADLPTTKPDVPSDAAPSLRDLGNGVYEIGGVKLDKNKKTVSFPAEVNMREGQIEYTIVNKRGKVHESLLATAVMPSHIHIAMLLLGAKGDPEAKGQAQGADAGKGGPLTAEQLKKAPAMLGDDIMISLTWAVDGQETRTKIEDLVMNRKDLRHATPGVWTYTGSRMSGDVFMADPEGSIATVIIDKLALINNPRLGHDDDAIWFVDTKATPPKGTPVQVTITLEAKKPK